MQIKTTEHRFQRATVSIMENIHQKFSITFTFIKSINITFIKVIVKIITTFWY